MGQADNAVVERGTASTLGRPTDSNLLMERQRKEAWWLVRSSMPLLNDARASSFAPLSSSVAVRNDLRRPGWGKAKANGWSSGVKLSGGATATGSKLGVYAALQDVARGNVLLTVLRRQVQCQCRHSRCSEDEGAVNVPNISCAGEMVDPKYIYILQLEPFDSSRPLPSTGLSSGCNGCPAYGPPASVGANEDSVR